MSVASESGSHSTLITAFPKVGLQSNQLETRGADTPYPKQRISDKTLKSNPQCVQGLVNALTVHRLKESVR